jgi:hypothetical protein
VLLLGAASGPPWAHFILNFHPHLGDTEPTVTTRFQRGGFNTRSIQDSIQGRMGQTSAVLAIRCVRQEADGTSAVLKATSGSPAASNILAKLKKKLRPQERGKQSTPVGRVVPPPPATTALCYPVLYIHI